MPKNIKAVPTQDFEDVVATASKYVEGLRVGSFEGVAEAFHKDAVMYGSHEEPRFKRVFVCVSSASLRCCFGITGLSPIA